MRAKLSDKKATRHRLPSVQTDLTSLGRELWQVLSTPSVSHENLHCFCSVLGAGLGLTQAGLSGFSVYALSNLFAISKKSDVKRPP